ncbi:MAG: nucleotidyltransferase domain-containing protein [Muribaculaceae bacterium]|nr:nucleotidyltransferase domain-containing protein [Muribaculaceae bacterium]
MKLIELNMEKIAALCRKYKVAKLWVFGSILTPRFNDNSDIDLLVIFDKTKIALLDMADVFFDFIYELEDLFGRKVDLTDYTAIKNKYFKEEVDEKKQLLWTA